MALPDDARRLVGILLQEPCSVIELRAIGVDGVRGRGILSGYFDNVDALIDRAEALDGKAKGVYVTLNAIEPALLARANNRTKAPESATSDRDVLRRLWLLVDIDPTRPSGISSSESEKEAAHEIMKEVGRTLRALGFLNPIVGDSGNGWHLLYRIDLPADDGGLVQRCLQALAFRFDTDAATIDQTVHNPARITKLFGTLVRKGDETSERPHRRSRLVHVPDEIRPVERRLLERLAADRPSEPALGAVAEDAFDVEGFLRQSGLEILRSGPWIGGRRWILEVCPFDPAHTDGAAYVVQFPSGAIAAGCHHNGCSGRTWADLRGMFDPDGAGRYGKPGSDHGAESRGRAEVQAPPWEEPIPLAPTHAPHLPIEVSPGWLGDWALGTAEATRSSPDLAFLLGLSTVSLAVTRKISVEVTPTWREPVNLYCCGVANVSEAKSPVFAAALGPVVGWETDERRRQAPVIEERATEAKVLEKRLKLAVDKAAKGSKGEMANAQAAAAALAECVIPPLPQLIADDASVEALDVLLVLHGEKLGVFSAEGTPFEIAAGRFSERANPEVFLKAWSGDMIRVNRVGRAGGVCEMPLFACGITVQPDVLGLIGQVKSLRGRGFAARWLYVVPEPLVGSRPARSAHISETVAEEYRRNVRALLDISWPEKPVAVRMTREAEAAFYAYRAELEPRLAPVGDLHGIRDWAAKTDRQLLRLAGVLHAADLAGQAHSLQDLVNRPLSDETMERAVRLVRAFVPHATVAFALMDPAGTSHDARYLLGRVRELARPRVSRREIRRAARRFMRDEEMEPALKALCEHGYLRLADRRSNPKGSPKKEVYEVHPTVLEGSESRAKRAKRLGGDAPEESEPASGTFGTPSTSAENQPPRRSGSTSDDPESADPNQLAVDESAEFGQVDVHNDAQPAEGDVPVDPERERDLGWAP